MAGTVRIFSWNMRNIGGQARSYPQLVDFIVEAIVLWRPQIVAIMEIRSGAGGALGAFIAAQLNAAWAGTNWQHQTSGQTGSLKEQYLYLWNATVVTGANFFPTPADVAAKNTFEDSAGSRLGFPRIGNITTHKKNYPYQNRPPFRGYFTENTTQETLPIYVFHADSSAVWATDGNRNLALINEATTDPRGVFMGDFNISPSDVNGGGRAHSAFTPLHHTLGYLQQIGGNELTSVKHRVSSGTVPVTATPTAADIQTCLASSYDNFFVKLGGFAIGNHDVGYLMVDCIQGGHLHDQLAACVQKKEGLGAPPVIGDLRQAFEGFSHYISDHLPIIMEIKYQ